MGAGGGTGGSARRSREPVSQGRWLQGLRLDRTCPWTEAWSPDRHLLCWRVSRWYQAKIRARLSLPSPLQGRLRLSKGLRSALKPGLGTWL